MLAMRRAATHHSIGAILRPRGGGSFIAIGAVDAQAARAASIIIIIDFAG